MESVQQFCRDLLSRAIQDSLVAYDVDEWGEPDPQCRSSGELTAISSMVNELLTQQAARHTEAVQMLRDLSRLHSANNPVQLEIEPFSDEACDLIHRIHEFARRGG